MNSDLNLVDRFKLSAGFRFRAIPSASIDEEKRAKSYVIDTLADKLTERCKSIIKIKDLPNYWPQQEFPEKEVSLELYVFTPGQMQALLELLSTRVTQTLVGGGEE
jgi:hypothetical protein